MRTFHVSVLIALFLIPTVTAFAPLTPPSVVLIPAQSGTISLNRVRAWRRQFESDIRCTDVQVAYFGDRWANVYCLRLELENVDRPDQVGRTTNALTER